MHIPSSSLFTLLFTPYKGLIPATKREPNLVGLDGRAPFSRGETGGGPIAPPFGLGRSAVMPSGASRWRWSSTASDFFDEEGWNVNSLNVCKGNGSD